MTDATCTVRCYGCDWTVTVVGMEAAQDAMSDHYKAKHWKPRFSNPAMSDPRLAVLRADIATAAVGAQEWRQLLEDCLDDLAECGANGMSRGDVAVFLRHWWDQVGTL